MIYLIKRLPSPVKFVFSVSIDPAAKNLLFFSLPLLVYVSGLLWLQTFVIEDLRQKIADCPRCEFDRVECDICVVFGPWPGPKEDRPLTREEFHDQ